MCKNKIKVNFSNFVLKVLLRRYNNCFSLLCATYSKYKFLVPKNIKMINKFIHVFCHLKWALINVIKKSQFYCIWHWMILLLTFHGMFAFQQRHASDKCWSIVLALFCLIPSGIMSTMSCITEARNSKSKCDSTRCLVTVLATPLECRPSNWRDNRFPNHLSRSGVIPLMKNSQTRQPGAQKPQPGPFPTGPYNTRLWVENQNIISIFIYFQFCPLNNNMIN